jgi:hypothetical protein
MEESQQLVALQNRIAEKWQQGEVTFGVKGEKEPMSDGCGVCLGGEPDCMAEFFEVDVVKARKVHKCCECGLEIAIGSKYVRESGKWEGEFASFKTCCLCAEIRQAFTCYGAICYGELWNDVREYLFPKMTTGCLEKLTTAAAKQFLIDRWNKWKFKRFSVEGRKPD